MALRKKLALSIRPPLLDSFGRVARKLRISVTDRCNFRCSFCMPQNPIWLPREQILTFEEIARVARILASMGVSKIRLTGGEPLVRKDVDKLVSMLAQTPGVEGVSLTTNGFYLAEMAGRLKEAGLQGVTVSLHSLKADRYEEVVGRRGVFERVLEGIEESLRVGLHPVKINVVVTRGCNDDEVLDFAELARGTGLMVRFIEYMPFDGRKLWDPKLLVSGKEIIGLIEGRYRLIPLRREPGATARLYKFADGSKGEVGLITSMTAPFCSDCDRIRLTADGKILPCLFGRAEYDLKPLLRGGASDDDIERFIRECFAMKFAGVEAIVKNLQVISHVRPMYTVGG